MEPSWCLAFCCTWSCILSFTLPCYLLLAPILELEKQSKAKQRDRAMPGQRSVSHARVVVAAKFYP